MKAWWKRLSTKQKAAVVAGAVVVLAVAGVTGKESGGDDSGKDKKSAKTRKVSEDPLANFRAIKPVIRSDKDRDINVGERDLNLGFGTIRAGINADTGSLAILFNYDPERRGDIGASIGWAVPIRIRLFDDNGQYLHHFQTAERFYPASKESRMTKFPPEMNITVVLIKETDNLLMYTVSKMVAAHTGIVELSFVN